MIAALGTFSLITRVGIAVGIVIVCLGSVALYNESKRKEGEVRLVERSKEQGQKINAKNEKVRRRAAEPGAFERLLEHDCRDC